MFLFWDIYYLPTINFVEYAINFEQYGIAFLEGKKDWNKYLDILVANRQSK